MRSKERKIFFIFYRTIGLVKRVRRCPSGTIDLHTPGQRSERNESNRTKRLGLTDRINDVEGLIQESCKFSVTNLSSLTKNDPDKRDVWQELPDKRTEKIYTIGTATDNFSIVTGVPSGPVESPHEMFTETGPVEGCVVTLFFCYCPTTYLTGSLGLQVLLYLTLELQEVFLVSLATGTQWDIVSTVTLLGERLVLP